MCAILSGCASIPPEQESARQTLLEKHALKFDSADDFLNAVYKNEIEAVKLYTKSLDYYPYGGMGDREETQGLHALQSAITKPEILVTLLQWRATAPGAKAQAWDKWEPTCPEKKDELFEILLKHGGKPKFVGFTVDHLAAQGCVDELKRFLALYPSGARGTSPDANADFYRGDRFELKRDAIYSKSARVDQNKYDKYVTVIALFREANQRECQNKVLQACKANRELAEIEAALKPKYQEWLAEDKARKAAEVQGEVEAKEQEKYEASGRKDFDRACGTLTQIEFDKKAVADEKKIAAVSGVVNKVVLYEATRRLQGDYAFLDAMKAQYKKKTGRVFNPKDCSKGEREVSGE